VEQSPTKVLRDVSAQLGVILSPVDVHTLPPPAQKAVSSIRQQIIDARLEVRDYDLAQTRAEQLALIRPAHERLEALHHSILAVSSHGIFGAADVAHLSAQIQHVISLLK